MTNYREILRLSSLGMNKTQIDQSIGCFPTTVIQVLDIAEEKEAAIPCRMCVSRYESAAEWDLEPIT